MSAGDRRDDGNDRVEGRLGDARGDDRLDQREVRELQVEERAR